VGVPSADREISAEEIAFPPGCPALDSTASGADTGVGVCVDTDPFVVVAADTCAAVDEVVEFVTGAADATATTAGGTANAGSSVPKKCTYAFTNAEGLNFGRHTGNHVAAADELRIEGEWMVFMRMWRSRYDWLSRLNN
jgi:hypothetical protein